MSYNSFIKLANMIQPKMQKRNPYMSKLNGAITNKVRLGCSLRYFAGGSSYNIASMFGNSVSIIYKSVWEVAGTLKNTLDLDISCLLSFQKQKNIANGFKKKLSAMIDCCNGAIDGILIWIHKPTDKFCKEANCNAGKFFCGRKKLELSDYLQCFGLIFWTYQSYFQDQQPIA